MILDISGDNKVIINPMADYLSAGSEPNNLCITLQSQDYIARPDGKLIVSEEFQWLSKPKNDGYFIYFPVKLSSDEVIILADVDNEWKAAHITYLSHDWQGAGGKYKTATEFYTRMLMGAIFRYRIIHYKGLVLHSSTIKWQGKGVAFTAPSGTGKSTHVKLWRKYFGSKVEVLNDDMPAIRLIDSNPFIFGTPWSGSSGIHCNDNAPLAAIVVLEQAPVNRLYRLTQRESVLRIMTQVPLPTFDPGLTVMLLDILESIAGCVPTYLLQCRPDREAVELVYEVLK